jgi:hypothetical protein
MDRMRNAQKNVVGKLPLGRTGSRWNNDIKTLTEIE